VHAARRGGPLEIGAGLSANDTITDPDDTISDIEGNLGLDPGLGSRLEPGLDIRLDPGLGLRFPLGFRLGEA
jgi:hypothetical protein